MLSFTAEVFHAHVASYNQAIWPVQLVAYALGMAVIGLAIWPRPGSDRFIGAVLAAAWIWTGVAFHLVHFARISFIAPAFAALFIVGGLLFGWTCAIRGKVEFRFRRDRYGWAGLVLLALAVAIYPLLVWSMGHEPQIQHFGVGPLATTYFTIGMLLLIRGRTPGHLVAVPLLWALIYGTMMWLLRDVQFLTAIGVLAWIFIGLKNRSLRIAAAAD